MTPLKAKLIATSSHGIFLSDIKVIFGLSKYKILNGPQGKIKLHT